MIELVEAVDLTRYFDLSRNQRVHAVENVSLSVGEREIVGLVGESGSGKTTFGKTLVGLHRNRQVSLRSGVKSCLKNIIQLISSGLRLKCK